jgi:initiation factor 1A
MVKNQNGGKNSKKMGRKFVTNPSSNNRKIRKAEEEGEMYAIVTKMLGNGMFYANDIEGKERLCIMRNKFRGRGKRDNTVALGSWVLIGEREFESCAKPKHDLLEVYSDIEKQKLKHSGDPIFSKLRSDFDSKDDSNNEADGLVFDNGEDDKYNELLETVYANTELDADPDLDGGDEKAPPSTITTSNNKIKNKSNDNKNTHPTMVTIDDGDEIDVDDI